jgi:hypothetical protein
MLAGIACAAMFLLAPAGAGVDLALALNGIDGGRAPSVLALKARPSFMRLTATYAG